MVIYVTGSNGFVGKHLCPRLLNLGYHVEPAFVDYTPQREDVIIHLAAKTDTSLEFNPSLIETNYFFTKYIFSYPSRIIFASSCSAGHLTNPYAYTKRYGEYLSKHHENSVSLRFHNIYGSGARRGIVKFLMERRDGEPIVIRGPLLIRDYIHVYDVCTQIINTINNGQTGVLDVGTGVGVTTIYLVNLFMQITGRGFEIDFAKAWDYEPQKMVASFPSLPHVDLTTGLLKTFYHEDTNYGSIL